jgi:hypothetical protein
MKNKAFGIIPILMFIIGCASCASIPVVAPRTSGSSSGKDLDVAIKEAAAQMEANIPARTTVALVSVASTSAQLSEYVISRLEAALVSGRKLVVVDRANLDKVRAEQGFQLSGDVDDNSAKAIGKLLGAGAIVTGSFTNLGDVYSLTLKAINLETATIAVSYPADIAKSTRIETMLVLGGGAAGVASGGGAAGVRTTPSMAPADGTYRFNPRIQAFQGARSVPVYLDRIVVRRGYMTIYIYNEPEGTGSGYGSSIIGDWKTATLTDMDNNRTARLVEAVPKGPPYGSACEYDLSFQNVTGTRLILASPNDRPPIEFYEIILEYPDN